MTGGYYYSKTSKDDVSLNSAVEVIAKRQSRSKSETIRHLLWVAVRSYNKKSKVVKDASFPKHNPIQKFITAR